MSIYEDILNTLATRVSQALVAASFTGIPVNVRKRPIYLEGDKLPSIVVAPDLDGEQIEFETFTCMKTTYIYPCVVSMFLASNRQQSENLGLYLDYRETIRNAIYKPELGGVLTVYDVILNTGGPFIQVEQRSNYELTTFRIAFKSDETRS